MAEFTEQFESVLEPLTSLEKVRAIRNCAEIVPIAICLEERFIDQLSLAERRRLLEMEDRAGWHAIMLSLDRLMDTPRCVEAIPALVDLLDFSVLYEISEVRLAALIDGGFHNQVLQEVLRFCVTKEPVNAANVLGALLKQPDCCDTAYEALIEALAGAPDNHRARYLTALTQAVGTEKEVSAARLLRRNFEHLSGEKKMLVGRRLLTFAESSGEIADAEKLLTEIEQYWSNSHHVSNDLGATLACLGCLAPTEHCGRVVALLISVLEANGNIEIAPVLQPFSAGEAGEELLQWVERSIRAGTESYRDSTDYRGTYLTCLGAFSQPELSQRSLALVQSCLSVESDVVFQAGVRALGTFAGTPQAEDALDTLTQAIDNGRLTMAMSAVGALRSFTGTPEGETAVQLTVHALTTLNVGSGLHESKVHHNVRPFVYSTEGPALLEGLWQLMQNDEAWNDQFRRQLVFYVLGAFADGPHTEAAVTLLVRAMLVDPDRYDLTGSGVEKLATKLLYSLCKLFQLEVVQTRDPSIPGGVDVPPWVQDAAKTK